MIHLENLREYIQLQFDPFSEKVVWISDQERTEHHTSLKPGHWFNIKMSSYQHRKFHCGDKAIIRLSYILMVLQIVSNCQGLHCLLQANIKVNTKSPHNWPFVRGIHRIPLTKGQLCGKSPHVMTSSWEWPCHSTQLFLSASIPCLSFKFPYISEETACQVV